MNSHKEEHVNLWLKPQALVSESKRSLESALKMEAGKQPWNLPIGLRVKGIDRS